MLTLKTLILLMFLATWLTGCATEPTSTSLQEQIFFEAWDRTAADCALRLEMCIMRSYGSGGDNFCREKHERCEIDAYHHWCSLTKQVGVCGGE